MTFDELRSFRETARRGSFSEAARALVLSQSAVSRQVQRLEAELGALLLDRAAGTVSPTPAGQVVLEFAERVLEDRESTLRQVRAAVGGLALLDVASSSAPAARLVPELVAGFRRGAPGVEVRLRVMNSAAVEDSVSGGGCDVGFLGRPPRNGHLSTDIIGHDRIVLAMGRHHPLAGIASVRLEMLEDYEWVVREDGSGTRDAVEAALRRSGRTLPAGHGRLAVDSGSSLLAQLRAGQGLGFLSLDQCRDVPGIAWADIDGLDLTRDLWVVYDPHRRAPALQQFLAFLGTRAGGR